MIQEVRVPRLSANEDEVLVTDVAVTPGQQVAAGDELFLLETTKVALAVEAPRAGFVRRIFLTEGEMAQVGMVGILLSEAPDTPLPDEEPRRGTADTAAAGSTAKQRLEAKKQAAKASPPDRPRSARPPKPADAGDLPWVAQARDRLGEVRTAARLFEVRGGVVPPDAAASTSGLENGSFGNDSLIRARRLFVEPGASVGAGTTIEAESVYLGRFAKIGAGTSIVAAEVILGDGAFCGHGVEVDVSGGKTELSRFLIGPASLVSPRCFVNVCREVVLEEEAAMSPGAMVFTHRFWQSVLDGFSADFRPVRLCRAAWVGGGCHVLPGVVVGEGATVMSNSTVTEDLPPFAFAAGVPAVVRHEVRPERVDGPRKLEILRQILREFAAHLELKHCRARCLDDGSLEVALPDGRRRRVVLGGGPADRPADAETVLVTLTGDGGGQALAVFDIAAKTFTGVLEPFVHELRNFLRRRGIRFTPHGWDGGFRNGLPSSEDAAS